MATKKYGKGAQEAVKKEMHAFKEGKAKIGKSKKPVKSLIKAVSKLLQLAFPSLEKKALKCQKKPKSKLKSKTLLSYF